MLFVAVAFFKNMKTTSGSRGWDEGPPRPPGSNDRSAPPPGFKNQSWAAPPSYEESCHSASAGFYQQRNHGNDGPGFFSGLGLGGLAGYLFARNQDRYYQSFTFCAK